ncbi:MAG: 6-carboxytetrahydropterin synthase [Sediminibacterium sp.]|nr:6-carboxytetrahydropterin synthase [Sediminibacterium sp.]
MIYLTRIEHFNAAHKLYNPVLTLEENNAIFGICANSNWHGHNYTLHVTVKGLVNPQTGFIFDVKKLSQIIVENIIDKLDHKNLNLDVPFMKDKLCSSENLVIGIWHELNKYLPKEILLHCIKLYETDSIYITYYGE